MTTEDYSDKLMAMLDAAGSDLSTLASDFESLRIMVLDAIASGAAHPAALARLAMLTVDPIA